MDKMKMSLKGGAEDVGGVQCSPANYSPPQVKLSTKKCKTLFEWQHMTPPPHENNLQRLSRYPEEDKAGKIENQVVFGIDM